MKKLLFACSFLLTCTVFAQPSFTFKEFEVSPGKVGSSPANFNIAGGKLLFSARDTSHGFELWATDGTDTGTVMLKDIYPGKTGGGPGKFVTMNNKAYFMASDPVFGRELWVSDGTDTGTKMVKDINVGIGNSDPQNKIVYNNKLIFAAEDSTAGMELWISDGTEVGTKLLKDIYVSDTGSYPYDFTLYNGKVYFQVNTANGRELWATDGTPSGTVPVPGIFTGNSIILIQEVLGKLYMLQYTSAHYYEIWVTDGTPGGTLLLKEVVPGPNFGVSGLYITEYKGKVLMLATTRFSVGKAYLYLTDGTPSGTQQLQVFPYKPGVSTNGISNFCEYDDKVYFACTDADQNGTKTNLWVTDGTVAGTKVVKNTKVKPDGTIPEASTLIKYNDYLYMTATINSGSRHITRYDGTDTGAITVSPPNPKNNPIYGTTEVIVYDSSLYYCSDYKGNGRELWALKDTSTRKKIITPPPGSVSNIEENNFFIYPNPTEGVFTVEHKKTIEKIEIYDQVMRRVYLSKPDQKHVRLNLQHLQRGVYLVVVTDNAGAYYRKLLLD